MLGDSVLFLRDLNRLMSDHVESNRGIEVCGDEIFKMA